MAVKPAILLTLLRGVERLAESILDRADVEIITLYDMTVPFMENRGLPFRTFTSFLPEATRDRVTLEAARRAKCVAEGVYSAEFRKQWPELDDGAYGAVLDEITKMVRVSLREEAVLIETLRRCAAQTDLRLIVVHQDICRDTKTLVQTGHRLGVPTLHIAHGYPYGSPNAISMRDAMAADVLAVYSERLRDTYLSLGFPPERLVVTGNPEWDIYTRAPMPGHRNYIAKTLGLDPARMTIVYAITYANPLSPQNLMHAGFVEKTTEAVVEAFAALAGRHPEWQFVLRPHPNDPDAPRALTELAERKGLKGVCIDNLTSAVSCLSFTDLLVCTHSNMGVEAIIAGKPVVNCVLDEYCARVFEEGVGPLFQESDAVVTVRDASRIAGAVEAALLDPGERERYRARRSETLRRFNAWNDGRAMERVCALVTGMLENAPTTAWRVERYPEFETVFARLVLEDAQRVFVQGRGAVGLATTLLSSRPDLKIDARPEWPGTADRYDAVILSEPLPHTSEAARMLAEAAGYLAPDGRVIAGFRHGGNRDAWDALNSGQWAPGNTGTDSPGNMGQYSRPGVEAVLGQAGLVGEAWRVLQNAEGGDAFVVEAPVARAGEDGFEERLCVDGWAVRAMRTGR